MPDAAIPPRLLDACVRVLADWDWAERPVAVVSVPSRSHPQLVDSLARGLADIGRLTSIPGVGKKTAERIAMELRDRLPGALTGVEGGAPSSPRDAERDDLASALGNLGYDRRAIDKALDAVSEEASGASFEQRLRAALKALSRA